jgi:hypothetical protein
MRRRIAAGACAGLLALVLAAPAAGVIPQKGKFAGTTSQANPDASVIPVEIKVTQGGLNVKRFAIGWNAPCDSGFTTLVQATRAQGPVSSRGKFHGSGSYKSTSGNLAGTQYSAQVTSKVKGTFTGERKAKGTFQATAVLFDATGAPVSTCTSPTVHWHAKHL